MNPSIKRLLGAVLLVGTLGVSCVMALKANATPLLDSSLSHYCVPTLERDINHG